MGGCAMLGMAGMATRIPRHRTVEQLTVVVIWIQGKNTS
ncbi:hypothetical protein SP19_54 [Salmonella phage 19]|nr:hypothetical protein SP19_54 [Salmonella phage 19]